MGNQQRGNSLLPVVVGILAVVLVVPLLMMVFSMPMMGMMGWWWNGGGPGTGLSPLWGIGMMLLFLAVLLGIGYFLFRTFVRDQISDRDPALEELRTAYARGELSDEEYEQRRKRLQEDQERR